MGSRSFHGVVLSKAEPLHQMIEAWFDGSCLPVNPGGTARVGAVIYQDHRRIAQISKIIGHGEGMSNNVGECAAVTFVLEYLISKNLQNEPIRIYGDSLLVINSINHLKPLRGLCHDSSVKAVSLSSKFTNAEFIWIPREQNVEADRLSNPFSEQVRVRRSTSRQKDRQPLIGNATS